jgi:ABC-2 type transport system ATP-binding protein
VPPGDTVLRAAHLVKRFGDLVAVDDFSLDIQAGEILGLLGPNGAGKTTAIGLLCGLLRPDSGEVFVQGRPVRSGASRTLRGVGLAPQDVVVWPRLTCLEQLEFVGEMYGVARPAARRRGQALLQTVGLESKQDKLARTLSGGMLRRLNFILALVHDPELLILDEPEAGLDPQSRVLIRELTRSLARQDGKTIILTTHNMDEADRLADRVAIIDRGRLLTLDTPEALKHGAGQEDILEIELRPESGALSSPPLDSTVLERALVSVRAVVADGTEVTGRGTSLSIRAGDAARLIPAIFGAIAAAGCRPGEVHLRGATLEDVFIALTGRSLRE